MVYAASGTLANQQSHPQALPGADAGSAGEPVFTHAAASAAGTHFDFCNIKKIKCTYSEFLSLSILPCQLRQQAMAGAQLQPSLPNGPQAKSPNCREGLPHSSPQNHAAIRPPCVVQPTANGSCSSPSFGPLDTRSPAGDHAAVSGGGSTSNGNVPYAQQNSLPHNCTGVSHPSTSSASPAHPDETWRSPHSNANTQVNHHFLFVCLCWSRGVH